MVGKETNELVEIRKRIDVLIGIVLVPELRDSANQKDKIAYLTSHDLSNKDIAAILNTTTNVVSKEKSIQKRRETDE